MTANRRRQTPISFILMRRCLAILALAVKAQDCLSPIPCYPEAPKPQKDNKEGGGASARVESNHRSTNPMRKKVGGLGPSRTRNH
ncbi:hypothetical protein GE09DRAFT_1080211 [Coniochaeta sp. 2T2.1]|nr:hypothetical protein GE09DRAFT_1080211 [Coniochaeta sp. 2T2.1]